MNYILQRPSHASAQTCGRFVIFLLTCQYLRDAIPAGAFRPLDRRRPPTGTHAFMLQWIIVTYVETYMVRKLTQIRAYRLSQRFGGICSWSQTKQRLPSLASTNRRLIMQIRSGLLVNCSLVLVQTSRGPSRMGMRHQGLANRSRPWCDVFTVVVRD